MLNVNRLDVYHGYVHALKNISLQVKQGEILAILGANGAGKSTLLGTLAGLYKPAAGEIIFQNKKIIGQAPDKIVRAGIGLIPEKREIFSGLSVLDNLMLGAFHRYRHDKADISREVKEILELFPLLKGREKDLAGGLSGGLQQMLAIGRALMARPSLLLLDEPSIGLAPLVVREIMAILVHLKETGVTVVLVEQNTKAALKVADNVLVMEHGEIIHSGCGKEAVSDTLLKEAYLGRSRK